MIATLVLGCVLSAAAGFLAGWWKGQADHSDDMQSGVDELRKVVESLRTDCAQCGALYQAMCPKGCASSPSEGSADG